MEKVMIPKRDPDRQYTVTQADFNRLGPNGITKMLKDYGFRFMNDTCPVMIEQPYTKSAIDGGYSTIYRQWDLTEEERQERDEKSRVSGSGDEPTVGAVANDDADGMHEPDDEAELDEPDNY
jgi:hypothetical protein